MTPPSGFLANRFGRKRVLLTAIAGFVIASILCGLSQSLIQIVVFRSDAGPVRRGARAAVAGHSSRPLRRQRARIGDGAVRRLGDGRAGARPGDRRLADRQHQLALGLLHQRADRRAGLRRHQHIRHRDQEGRAGQARLARLRRAQHRDRRAADFPRSRRAARLVLVGRNHHRGDRLRGGLLRLPGPHVHCEVLLRESETVSRSQFFDQFRVHFHRRRHLSRVAGADDALSADPDGLSRDDRRPRHGAARARHDGFACSSSGG